jgi:hypothetical protein
MGLGKSFPKVQVRLILTILSFGNTSVRLQRLGLMLLLEGKQLQRMEARLNRSG